MDTYSNTGAEAGRVPHVVPEDRAAERKYGCVSPYTKFNSFLSVTLAPAYNVGYKCLLLYFISNRQKLTASTFLAMTNLDLEEEWKLGRL